MRKKRSAAERNKKYQFTFLNGSDSSSSGSSGSELGPHWVPMYTTQGTQLHTEFTREDFETAMLNLIEEPGINSNAIQRADILERNLYELTEESSDQTEGSSLQLKSSESQVIEPPQGEINAINFNDTVPRHVELPPQLGLYVKHEIVRRVIPRNPFKDPLINQTCLILNSFNDTTTSLVVLLPHLEDSLTSSDEWPYYLPNAKAVALLFKQKRSLSIHYLPFPRTDPTTFQDETNRVARIAYKLLLTSFKHSLGTHNGYEKRVNHDLVVDRAKLQNRYLLLKQKYSEFLMSHWVESTDPKKHVFEDLLIAAFLMELWLQRYGDGFAQKLQFRDLGCGNGVLVFILISEGLKGYGVDARERKTWSVFPSHVRDCLRERIIVPSILLTGKTTDELDQLLAASSSPERLETTEYPENTFLIGNHSDELTCWIPLLGYPFCVIPCCSHNLSGQKCRYNVRKCKSPQSTSFNLGNSTYAGLVDHVDHLAEKAGWLVEREMLRIPSTRNAAIIGFKTPEGSPRPVSSVVMDIIAEEGGASSWVKNAVKLMKQGPRSH